MINPELNGLYESTGKVKEEEFRHPTLGLINLATINAFTAEKLVKKGYLRKLQSPEAELPKEKKPKKQ